MKIKGTIFILLFFLFSKAQDNNILAIADSMPKFPGGNGALTLFMMNNLYVPTDVKGAFKAYVKFVVNSNGKVMDPVIIKSSGNKIMDDASINMVSKMPNWEPGINNGERVSVYMNLPVAWKNLGVIMSEEKPASEEHIKAMEIYNEGHKLEQQGKYSQALEKFNQALKIESDNKFAMFDKAKMHLALGEKSKASNMFKSMIQSDIRKDESESYLNKYCGEETDSWKFLKESKSDIFFKGAMVNVNNGRYEAALIKFDSCLKYTPDNRDALYNKGVMQYKLEQKNQACMTWKRLSEISPNDKEVQDLIIKNCN